MSMVAARDATPVLATTAPQVGISSETWVSTHDGAAHDSATGAHQAARISRGIGTPSPSRQQISPLRSRWRGSR